MADHEHAGGGQGPLGKRPAGTSTASRDRSTRQGLGPDENGFQASTRDDVDEELEALRRDAAGPEAEEVDSSQSLPGWERANMPEGEWKRALAASDAAIEREQPGSAEFARLMEVRIRLHFPRPKRLSWEDIEAFKAAQYRAALAEDLRRELRRSSDTSVVKWVVMTIVVFVLAAIVGMLVYAVMFMPRPEVGAVEPLRTKSQDRSSTLR